MTQEKQLSDKSKASPVALLTKILAQSDSINSPNTSQVGVLTLSPKETAPSSTTRSPGESSFNQTLESRFQTQGGPVLITDTHLKHL